MKTLNKTINSGIELKLLGCEPGILTARPNRNCLFNYIMYILEKKLSTEQSMDSIVGNFIEGYKFHKFIDQNYKFTEIYFTLTSSLMKVIILMEQISRFSEIYNPCKECPMVSLYY